MQKEEAQQGGVKIITRKCMRCGTRLRHRESFASICDACAQEVLKQEKRMEFLFMSYAFHLAILIFVLFYFYKGGLLVYEVFMGGLGVVP